MPSGYTFGERRSTFHGEDAQQDIARVVNVPPHKPDDLNQHIIQVQFDSEDPNSTVWTTVNTMGIGDVNVPQEGDIVRVGYEKGNRPIVMGVRYNAKQSEADPRLPKYGPGHRRISGGPHDPENPDHDAHVEIFPDGAMEICSAQDKPLTICDDTTQMFLVDDFTYAPNETFFHVPFDRVNTRLFSQSFLDEHNISTVRDTAQLPLWDDATYEWVLPPEPDVKYREPDPRGALWTIESTIRFEQIEPETACEVGLFIREKGESLSNLQLIETAIAHGSVADPIPALTVDVSCTERFPYESRVSIHVRSATGGGTISSDPTTYDGAPANIQSQEAGGVELWDTRDPPMRQTTTTLTRA